MRLRVGDRINKFLNHGTALYINILLLISHIAFLVLFIYTKVEVLAFVNVISVCLYSFCFYLVNKSKYIAFLWVIYCEIAVYLIIGTLCLGWEYGFYLYCFTLTPIAYLIYYSSSQNNKVKISPFWVSIITTVVYMLARFYIYFFGTFYTEVLDKKYIFTLFTINSIIVFGFIILYMRRFVSVILNYECELLCLAEKDELTQLYNRRKMRIYLEEAHNQAIRNKKNYCVTIFDLDDFKRINDQYGHDCGDTVLKEIAKLMDSKTNPNIKVCRWGGEEFLMLHSNQDDVNSYISMTEEIVSNVEELKVNYGKNIIQVTITAGISVFKNNKTIEEVIKLADEKLYIGKRNGKNCVKI